jgi:hypothetical protein
MKEIFFQLEKQRPIAFRPIYAHIMGNGKWPSIYGGLLLSQLVYWASRMDGNEFFKTDEELRSETLLGEDSFSTAKSRLKELGIFAITLRGVPAKSHYLINTDILFELIRKHSELVTGEPTHTVGGEPPKLSYTEITTEREPVPSSDDFKYIPSDEDGNILTPKKVKTRKFVPIPRKGVFPLRENVPVDTPDKISDYDAMLDEFEVIRGGKKFIGRETEYKALKDMREAGYNRQDIRDRFVYLVNNKKDHSMRKVMWSLNDSAERK